MCQHLRFIFLMFAVGALIISIIIIIIIIIIYHLYLLKRCKTTYSETGHNVSRPARLLTRRTHSRPRKRKIIKIKYKIKKHVKHETYTYFKNPVKSTALIVGLKADKLAKLTQPA